MGVAGRKDLERTGMVDGVKEEEVELDGIKQVVESLGSPSFASGYCKTEVPRAKPVTRRTSGPTRRSTKGQWTEDEDAMLERLVKQYNGKHWKTIAEYFPGRKDVQCLHRWQKVLNPELIKGPWTKEEDDLITQKVKKLGKKKWSQIAKSLPGRIGKQCRERWHNHLNPAIKKDAWTTEEEITLIRAHRMFGNKWAEISKVLPGRADNAIKNHWNCSVKKKLDWYSSSGHLGQQPAIGLGSNNNEGKGELLTANLKGPGMNIVPFDKGQLSNDILRTLSEGSAHGSAIPRRQILGFRPLLIEDSECSNIEVQARIGEDSKFPKVERNDFSKKSVCCDNKSNVKEVQAGSRHGDEVRLVGADAHSNCARRLCQRYDHANAAPHSYGIQSKPSATMEDQFLLPQVQSHETITETLLGSTEKIQGHAFTKCGITIMDAKLDSEGNTSSLQVCASVDGITAHNHQESPSKPMHAANGNSSLLPYPHLQLSDLDISAGDQKFLKPEGFTMQTHSPICSTPPDLSLGISLNAKSPESILRSAAKSFKNTPSILRKRRSDSLRPSVTEYSLKFATCDASVDTTLKLATCQNESHNGQADIIDADLSNVKHLCLSSVDYLKPELQPPKRSIEKRLDFEFDMEWTANTEHGISISCNSPKAKITSSRKPHCIDSSQVDSGHLKQRFSRLMSDSSSTCD